jgi:hypothetical protein
LTRTQSASFLYSPSIDRFPHTSYQASILLSYSLPH